MAGIRNIFGRAYIRGLLAGPARNLLKRAGVVDFPATHQVSAHWVISRYISIEGKKILEIGGAQSGEAAQPFLNDGAATVTISGLDHVTEEKSVSSKLRIMHANALSLSDAFEPNSFDIVYGLSIVEHIPSPKIFLRELNSVLRPGGVAYLEGNPLWSSPKGHHLWVATWGGLYQHKATANYLFSEFPNKISTNPLPDWSHLLMDQDQMRKYLQAQSLPGVDIECIVDWVYRSDQVNRLNMSEIADAYSSSKLVLLEANTRRSRVPPDVEAALRKRCGEGIDYGTSGISYVLTKR
jgi:SAM-dependent methyltransferase